MMDPLSVGKSETAATQLQRLVPGVRPLAPRLAAAVDAGAAIIQREAGAVLMEPGVPCAGMLLLERGAMRVNLPSDTGRTLTLYHVHPGEICVLAAASLLAAETYPARAEVECAIRGVLVTPEPFALLMAESPGFRHFVLSGFGGRLREVLSRVGALAFERLDRRLAEALLDRVRREAGPDLNVTHLQLANELGCSREAASRLLESLAAAGVVTLGRGRMRVRDQGALMRQAARPD